MDPTVKQDILAVLADAIEAVRQKDFFKLSELSNHTIHNASVFQDEDSISVAILMYALAKVMQRCCEQNIAVPAVLDYLKAADGALVRDRVDDYRDTIGRMFSMLKKVDKKVNLYIDEVLDKARVKKGSKLYEHGLSIGRAASILGISQWELMSYVGKTTAGEQVEPPLAVKKRIAFAKRLFGEAE